MLDGKILPLASLFALALNTSLPLNASENTFSQAYSDYQTALKQGDDAQIEASAKRAFELGEAQYAKDSVDLANLAMNWAGALKTVAMPNLFEGDNAAKTAKAYELYQLALSNYKKHYGEHAAELIDPLLGAAETSPKLTVAKELFENAIEIAEKTANKKLLADVKIATFDRLTNTGLYTAQVRDYAFEAYETYKEILPENALDRVKATYVVGAVEYAEKHDDKAIPLLLEVVKQFEALKFSHPYALSAHAYLVELYERQGKREESTAHCIAIGKMRPWADTQEQQPLFRTTPKYPKSYLIQRKSGYVTLNFTVDEMGFVKNPEVLESKGGVLFEKSTLKMIEEWRYAPKFEHGKPVPAQTTVRIDYFTDKS
ncbi:energy transducer TonB [Shewanella mangrovisoli]|uniref:energy transducer TonB n=1 Tax=Shewanella mangrovisoli TaxID=2864211 RepID=UPI001C65C5CD|nr:energy transducer TonB [Shewanella mangrovisoli]QYK08688.1 energy transducer TonB [Shewanella mangrovisoli]